MVERRREAGVACPSQQVQYSCIVVSTVGKFNMTAGEWKGGWKTHGRDANGSI